jgi:hypothetical protein
MTNDTINKILHTAFVATVVGMIIFMLITMPKKQDKLPSQDEIKSYFIEDGEICPYCGKKIEMQE